MRGFQPLTAMAGIVLVAVTGCSKAKVFAPSHPLPAGTLLIHFTKPVDGPIDLLVDDVRIPVTAPKKKAQNLTISGLAPGTHRYFISSPREAFGPDHREVTLPADQGIFLVNFAQHFNAVLYGKPEPPPSAPGLPGVTARLER